MRNSTFYLIISLVAIVIFDIMDASLPNIDIDIDSLRIVVILGFFFLLSLIEAIASSFVKGLRGEEV